MRRNVRREKKKYEASKKSWASPDELYKHKFWYNDLFNFLGDQDIPNTAILNLDDEESEEIYNDVSKQSL